MRRTGLLIVLLLASIPLASRAPLLAGSSPIPSQSPARNEARSALGGYTAYFGTDTVDPQAGTITHHYEGSVNPTVIGRDAVRRYEFTTGDGLVLVPETPMTRSTWQRVPPVPPAARTDIAPSGRLRVGINHGNPVLATRDPATGALRGVAVDLAREIGRRMELPVDLVPFESAGQMAAANKNGAWDVAFLALDATRANEISFTAAYVEVEGTYLVPPGSPIRSVADVDREGVRIAVSASSVYDLYLKDQIKHATLVRAPNTDASMAMFMKDKLEAVAFIRQPLMEAAKKMPGSRVLDDRFMIIAQAVGVPKGREDAVRYLRAFVEDVKASGMVASLLKKHGTDGTVAPQAAVK